jgi:predicted phosphodiesterase
MRLVLISDVHGNAIALEAVLADVAAVGGADAYWIVGDHAAIGPSPVEVLERLKALPNARFTRGNTDRYVVTGERPAPQPDDVRANVDQLRPYGEVQATFAWTAGAVAATGWLDWLAALPLDQRLTLPDGTRLLAVHAAPGTDDGPGVPPTATDEYLRGLVEGAGADLVVVGHTHFPVDRVVDGVRIVNLGSVSNPLAPDLRASYALLTADAAGHRLEHRRVPYDHAAVIAAVRRVRHPAPEFIIRHQRGGRRPPWEAP